MGPLALLLIAAAPALTAGCLLLARLRRHRLLHGTGPPPPAGRLPHAGDSSAAAPAPSTPDSGLFLSIIIPARNEAHNLPALLDSLRGQCPAGHEILVIDDDSTDATAEVARARGARVIPGQPLSGTWRGKTWACQQGADTARGEWLLFLDADTWLELGGLTRILHAAGSGGPTPTPPPSGSPAATLTSRHDPLPAVPCALSVGPWHAVREPWEQLSAFFNLLMHLGTVPHGLFGPVLLIDRASYQLAGGHEAVKDCVLENFRLAEKLRAAGVPARSFGGCGVVSYRMYPGGIRDMIEGWTKGFASGAKNTPPAVLAVVSLWLGGLCLGVAGMFFPPWGPLLYLAFAFLLGRMLREVGRFGWLTALLYPLPLAFYLVLFLRSCLRSGKPVTWKGRVLDAN